VRAIRVDPRDQSWQHDDAIFRVYFWRNRHGSYESEEFEVREADVSHVLAWAERERRDRIFAVYLRHNDASGVGLVLLAGTDPTA
jgi:hypothetical protein